MGHIIALYRLLHRIDSGFADKYCYAISLLARKHPNGCCHVYRTDYHIKLFISILESDTGEDEKEATPPPVFSGDCVVPRRVTPVSVDLCCFVPILFFVNFVVNILKLRYWILLWLNSSFKNTLVLVYTIPVHYYIYIVHCMVIVLLYEYYPVLCSVHFTSFGCSCVCTKFCQSYNTD